MITSLKYKTNAYNCLEILWQSGFFKIEKDLSDISKGISEKWGHNFSSIEICKALKKASFLKCTGKKRSFRYIQKISPVSKKIQNTEEELFSKDFLEKLGKSFEIEIGDLHLNFNNSGNCTAFLLRKILEKLLYITFAKANLSKKLEDTSGKLLGLEAIINIACAEKVAGVPFLIPKTGEKVRGIKFLGDVSAHNPLTNVDMETIIPQMPYIIIAYKELAEKL